MTAPPPPGYGPSWPHGAPQPPPQPGGQATIAINCIRGIGGGTLFGATDPKGPTVLVDGHQVPAQWGQTVVPVPAGRHHVRVFVPYKFPKEYGPATTSVDVAPGQTVPLEYRAPKFTFSSGALGPPPQRARGIGASLLVVAAIFLVVCVCSLIVVALQ